MYYYQEMLFVFLRLFSLLWLWEIVGAKRGILPFFIHYFLILSKQGLMGTQTIIYI